MSLRVLVVGRGDRIGIQGSNSHNFSFRSRARSQDGHIIEIQNFDFVFQHLGPANREAADAIREWQQAGFGSRTIGFSGGGLPKRWQLYGIVLMERIGDVVSLPWHLVPENFAGNAGDLVKLLTIESLEFLPALAILCQGYLAVHAKKDTCLTDPNVKDALRQMGWSSEMHASIVNAEVSTVQDPAWWLEIFDIKTSAPAGHMPKSGEKNWDLFLDKIGQEWGPDKESFLRSDLIHTLRENRSLVVPQIVAKAYLQIMKRLGAEPVGKA